jgi:hypothetical protein
MLFFGIYKGICVNNNDPENRFRITVSIPQVFGDGNTQSAWAWPCFQPDVASTLPDPGEGVWVTFEGGDVENPVWMGMWTPTPATPPTPSGGLTLISKQVVSTPTNTITFSAIPQTYTHLRLLLNGRCDDAGIYGTILALQMNGDTGTNYDFDVIEGPDGILNIQFQTSLPYVVLGGFPAATADGNRAGVVVMDILDYKETTFWKNALGVFNTVEQAGPPHYTMGTIAGTWQNTAAISSLVISDTGGGHFIAGTVASLYGVS